jgi:hypothetical protein
LTSGGRTGGDGGSSGNSGSENGGRAGSGHRDGGSTDSGPSAGGTSPNDAAVRDGASPSADAGVTPFDGGVCDAVETSETLEPALHVTQCSYVTWGSNPPSSGSHYGTWTAFKEYTTPIPEGFWVHDLEHGAVVLTYNCPSGCAADVDAARAFIAALSDDAVCLQTAGVRRRVILTPDPKLDVPFAASAWGFTLKANCFDPVRFGNFVAAHYGHGPEDICSDGPDVSVGLPAGCGDPP